MRKIYNFFFSMVLLLTFGQLSAQDFSVINTGSNMTVFMTQGFASEANVANIGIFFTNDAGELQCAGSPLSMPVAGQPFQITLWGSEAGLDNGMAAGEEFTWLAIDVDGNALDVTASYLPADVPPFSNQGFYALNETAFVASLDISSSEPPAPTTATVEFAVDMNLVDQPSADYDNVVVNGSWNGWQGWGVQLSDEDGDGVFTGSLEVDPGTSFEYVVAVTGAADSWSGWGMQWGDGCANANVAVTAGDAGSVTSSSLTPGCADVVGCMDANASNYNADATLQGYDQWGNLQCVYASCDDIPEYGCIYADGFGAFNEGFDAVACASYGGTPCEPAPPCEGSLVTINMFDSYGDGGGSVTLAGVTATNSGASSSTEVCVDLSVCNTVDYEATDSWSYENAWSIVDADGNELASGADADGLVGNCVSGCSDETAENYNADADIADDSLCEYALVQGCMDESACNYDSAAEQDNGSCTYAAEGLDCDGNCLSGELLTMTDSWGDGWNGAVLTINGVDYTIESGASATACVNLEACNTVAWTAGSYDGETSWTLADLSGAGGSGTGAYGDCGVAGCTDATACNYNADASTDDGSCELPVPGFDCDGNCLSGDVVTINMFDSYGDGGGSVSVGGVTATNAGISSPL